MTTLPDRLTAALADRYRIERPLGEGGMATVYLADDLKHDRKVAIKVLKPELAAVIGGERFLTEIRTTANLQHPHILPLFDSGEADSFLFYVMPYIEGESLRGLLDREKQLAVDEAVSIARDVAEALDYAHRHDIVHRDIKPENILLHDGNPVVADFGIALAVSAAGGGRMTETGLSLGTPHYMSPEQASADRDLSARSDVYSLGCVLYEMLAGDPPHTGPSAQSVLVRILTESPRPVNEVRPSVPLHVAAAVSKATEKLPADRFATAEEFGRSLDDRSFTYTAPQRSVTGLTAAPAMARPDTVGFMRWVPWGLAAVFGAVALWGGGVSPPAPEIPTMAFVVDTGRVQPRVGLDGTMAWTRTGDLFLRSPSDEAPRRIESGENARYGGVAFSPNGESIVLATFAAGGTSLTRRRLDGSDEAVLWQGEEDVLSPVWSDDGWIYVFAHSGGTPLGLHRVRELGGDLEPVEFGQMNQIVFPTGGLPGGRGIFVTMGDSPPMATGSVGLLSTESGELTTLADAGSGAVWSSTGHVVYGVDDGTLRAIPFDLESLQALGDPVPVREGVAAERFTVGAFDLSATGTLVYRAGPTVGGGPGGAIVFGLLGPDGEFEAFPMVGTTHPDGSLSPDGMRLVYTRDTDIWVLDLDLGTHIPISTGPGHHNPIWSPDGTRVAYQAVHGGVEIRSADGTGDAFIVFDEYPATPRDWLEDGTILLATEGDSVDVLSVPEGGGEATPLLRAEWNETQPQVSPDGNWIAYRSTRSGNYQAYLRSWPGLENEVRVSGGNLPVLTGTTLHWTPDGGGLLYRQGPDIIRATLDFSGTPRVTARDTLPFNLNGTLRDVAPDGRLLVVAFVEGDRSDPDESDEPVRLIAVTNWFPELLRRMGQDGG